MSILINTESISKRFGMKTLFEDVSFGIHEGDKVALIGVNGSGKSTLLNILANREEPDQGKVSRSNELKVSILDQQPSFDPKDSILGFIYKDDSPLMRLVRDYNAVMTTMETDTSEEVLTKFDQLNDRMDKEDGRTLEANVASILAQMGMHDLELKMGALSGGMAKKVAIARTLVNDSNLIFMDEPTNHLDLDTIVWLQANLAKTKKALILITHDRYFLDEVCNKIIEIDQGETFTYDGNFSYYLEKRVERMEHEASVQKKLANTLRRELEWVRRGPKARGTKQKARKDRFEEMSEQVKGPKQEMGKFATITDRQGGKILDLKHVSYGYSGNKVIDQFEYYFQKKERLGIIGVNGAGKTTLLNLISGRIEPQEGERDEGVNTNIAYFDQTSESLNPDETVLEYLENGALQLKEATGKTVSVTTYLEKFLFPTGMFNTPIAKLSGGEKRRLYLIRLLITNPNFLILDEPTNDLDIQTLSLLEDFLEEFTGTVVIVSHDRYFLDKTVNHLLVLRPGKIDKFPGNCSQFLAVSTLEEKPSNKKINSPQTEKVKTEKKVLSFKEQKEFEGLETEIARLEKEKDSLEALFSNPDQKKLEETTKKYNAINHEYETKINRWEELAERAD